MYNYMLQLVAGIWGSNVGVIVCYQPKFVSYVDLYGCTHKWVGGCVLGGGRGGR